MKRWGAALIAALVAAGTASVAAAQEPAGTAAPEVRFHLGGEELLPIAYPDRYRDAGALEDDVEWTVEASEDLRAWWAETGPTYLRRVADLTGIPWPVEDIDVYLVRYWPIVSIERPLVLALDAVRSSSGLLDLPDDEDLRVLLLAHQLVHAILEDPGVGPTRAMYAHPLLAPGDFRLEAMVNWVTYEALEDVWGAERLERATATDLWRGYNPNHAFVTEALREDWSLSRTRPLRAWLEANPAGSEIHEVADRYRREAGIAEPRGDIPERVEDRTGTEHGADLGATYDGEIFVAWVDEGSAADRAGLRQGDVIVTIEGRPVEDVIDAQRRMNESWSDNEEINLSVRRGESEVFVTVGA